MDFWRREEGLVIGQIFFVYFISFFKIYFLIFGWFPPFLGGYFTWLGQAPEIVLSDKRLFKVTNSEIYKVIKLFVKVSAGKTL